jgi:hypothetical protein
MSQVRRRNTLLTAAKMLGLTIPQPMQPCARRVIECVNMMREKRRLTEGGKAI